MTVGGIFSHDRVRVSLPFTGIWVYWDTVPIKTTTIFVGTLCYIHRVIKSNLLTYEHQQGVTI